ncbi:hypothetical protein BaRGS_00029722 [Batillaria attramentaria]|uniref:Uncharacterized protein n=1 Tax=Batillaria attramentaria TaxID=370345 RepID=A0ABD0JVQ0_9CAEN
MFKYHRLTTSLCMLMITVVGVVKPTGNPRPNDAAQTVTSPPDSLGPNDVIPIFELMREDGERRLANENKRLEDVCKENGLIFSQQSQYLVAIVVSREEIEEVIKADQEARERLFAAFPNQGRHIFKTNYNSDEKPKCSVIDTDKYPWHGEIIAIEKGYIDNAVKAFGQEQSDKDPIVLIYSHYIPCARVGNTGYSCSEQLANFRKGRGNMKMLVAFTTYYYGTDGRAAHDFMKNGGITAFQNMVHTYRVFLPSSVDNKQGTFQEELFDCLYQLPLSRCCTGETKRKRITAFFVNTVTYTCCFRLASAWQRSPFYPGGINIQGKKNFLDRASEYITEQIGDDCEPCSRKSPRDLLASQEIVLRCVEHSLSVARAFGQPSPWDNPYSPRWSPYSGKHPNPYPPNANPATLKKQIFCEKRQYSVESFCTKLQTVQAGTSDDGWVEVPAKGRRNQNRGRNLPSGERRRKS